MVYLMRTRYPTICLSTHTALTDQASIIDRAHHAHLLGRAAILSTHADYDNDASQALSELSMTTQLWFLRNVFTGQPYLGALTEAQDRLNLRHYTDS